MQLCESVAKKLEGKVMGTFTSKWPRGLLLVGFGAEGRSPGVTGSPVSSMASSRVRGDLN